MARDARGDLLLIDDRRVRSVNASGVITTIVQAGAHADYYNYVAGMQAADLLLGSPSCIALSGSRTQLAIADSGYTTGGRVYAVDLSTGVASHLAGSGSPATSGNGGAATSAGMRPVRVAYNFASTGVYM